MVRDGRYTFSMELREPSDLTNISFDEFVSLIFDRDTPPEAGKLDASFYHLGAEVDAKKMCAYYGRLFQEPEFLVLRFTKPVLAEGFLALMGHTIALDTLHIN